MNLENDYRNIEYGWSGGLSEVYTMLYKCYHRVYSLKTKGFEICRSAWEDKKQTRLILEALTTFNIPERMFICDYITNVSEVYKAYENKREEYIDERKKEILKKLEPESLDIKNISVKLYDRCKNIIEESLFNSPEKLDKNIIKDTIFLNEIISENKSLKLKDVENIVEDLIKEIEEELKEFPPDVPNREYVELFVQMLGVELLGSKGKKSDGNIVDGALYLIKLKQL